MSKEDKTFYLHGGKAVKTLKSLAKELKGMSTEVYDHHVNPVKNDFSNWIRNSLMDDELAHKVKGHMGKIEMELEVLRHLLGNEAKSKVKKVVKKAKTEVKAGKKVVRAKASTVKKKVSSKTKKIVKKNNKKK